MSEAFLQDAFSRMTFSKGAALGYGEAAPSGCNIPSATDPHPDSKASLQDAFSRTTFSKGAALGYGEATPSGCNIPSTPEPHSGTTISSPPSRTPKRVPHRSPGSR
ncbi:hypothetical protein P0Y35_17290, partial [Kiritimatiellaeota bacterium B1221]|nr:hypothetical protein [Kiritimatiellaeota bacterium B1221]